MRDLERDELIPTLRERDHGRLRAFQYEQLAAALKKELDVTLLCAQDRERDHIHQLLNWQTKDRMKQGALAVAPYQTPLHQVAPADPALVRMPALGDNGLPEGMPDKVSKRPERLMSDPTPKSDAAPSSNPSEAPSAMAA